MSKYLVISSDGHAGPPADVYRGLPRPGVPRGVRRATRRSWRAGRMVDQSGFVEEWDEETGDHEMKAGLRPERPRRASSTRRAWPPRCCSPTPTCSAPGGWPARRSGRASARAQGVDPAAVKAGARAHNRWLADFCATNPAPAHRRGGRADHRRGRRRGRRGPRGGRGRAAGRDDPDPLVRRGRLPSTRRTTRCGRRARRPGWCCTPTPVPARPTTRSGPGFVSIYAAEAWWWAARPFWVLAAVGRVRAPPGAEVLDRRERRLVGARPRRAAWTRSGTAPTTPASSATCSSIDLLDEAERLRRPQLLLRRLDPRRRRDRPPPRDRRRQPAVGQRPAPPRGHVPPHPQVDRRAVPGRARGRDRQHPRPQRRRPSTGSTSPRSPAIVDRIGPSPADVHG